MLTIIAAAVACGLIGGGTGYIYRKKIAEGKMRKFFEENTLLNQAVVGEKETIAEFIHKADKEATVIAYKRFALGE